MDDYVCKVIYFPDRAYSNVRIGEGQKSKTLEHFSDFMGSAPTDTTTAWTRSVTMTSLTPSLDAKWPRDTRPVSAWRTRAVIQDSGGATHARPTHR